MKSFTKETYEEIKANKPKELRTGYWYDATYETYIRILEDNKLDKGSKGFYDPDDIVLAASFAFSWLARIPSLPKKTNSLDDLVGIIHRFNQIDQGVYDTEMDEKIIKELVSTYDNSVVAVSKMIHFLSPNYFPIIDSKVIESWNKLFPVYKLPKKIDIDRYLIYAKYMRDWSLKSGVSLRELEKAIFEFAG